MKNSKSNYETIALADCIKLMNLKILIPVMLLFFSCSYSKSIMVNPRVDSFEIFIELEQNMLEAIEKGDINKLSNFIERGYNINKRTSIGGSTLLLEAIYKRKSAVVKFLLNEGADPNLRSAPFYDAYDNLIQEDSPLESAIVFDTLFSVEKILIESGANINDTDINYGTVLNQVFNGKGISEPINEDIVLKKIKWLISNGADVNKADAYGQTPLFTAGSMDLKKSAKMLLTKGARANIKDTRGETLLFRLADTSLARLYINARADVNAQSIEGLTALHHAVFANNFDIAKLLIVSGANVNLRDYDSRLTPLDWIIIEPGTYSTELMRLLITNDAVIDYSLARQYGVTAELKKIEEEASR